MTQASKNPILRSVERELNGVMPRIGFPKSRKLVYLRERPDGLKEGLWVAYANISERVVLEPALVIFDGKIGKYILTILRKSNPSRYLPNSAAFSYSMLISSLLTDICRENGVSVEFDAFTIEKSYMIPSIINLIEMSFCRVYQDFFLRYSDIEKIVAFNESEALRGSALHGILAVSLAVNYCDYSVVNRISERINENSSSLLFEEFVSQVRCDAQFNHSERQ